MPADDIVISVPTDTDDSADSRRAYELHVYGVDPRTIEADIRALPDAPERGLSVYEVSLGVLIYIEEPPTDLFKESLAALLHTRTLEEAIRQGVEAVPPSSDADAVLEQIVDLLKANGIVDTSKG